MPSRFRKSNAQSTNDVVNQFGKAWKYAGRGMEGISVANEANNIYHAPEKQRVKEATGAAGRPGGAFIGGSAGAAVGSLGCNPGTVPAGSLIGGTAGSMAGEKAVDVMWDMFGK